jgi:hypothetical protein
MKKLLKILLIIFIFFAVSFGIYAYKLHSLAVEGNKIFEQRCLVVNPPLISYKNNFLKMADYLKNPDQYKDGDALNFYRNYIGDMRKYIYEETKWLETQGNFINRQDYQLIEPSYLKLAGEYQWKMYEGYRDDAQSIMDIVDKKTPADEADSGYSEQRQRRDKYTDLYFETFDEASKINDWRKIFGNVPAPEGCNEENSKIPYTGGAMDL